MWHTGLVALRHLGSSQTRAQTHVPCIGRRILNHCTTKEAPRLLFFFNFIYLFYLWLCWVFVSVRGLSLVVASRTTLHRGAQASHYRGLSCCGAQAPDAQAQQLWLTGPVVPRHVGSSQTRARTRVPCTGRQIFNHCATREAQGYYFLSH